MYFNYYLTIAKIPIQTFLIILLRQQPPGYATILFRELGVPVL